MTWKSPTLIVLSLLALVALAFLLVPLMLVVAVSFSPSVRFDLPMDGLSIRWYAALGGLDSFWRTLGVSLRLAALATGGALVLGIMAAMAVHFGRFPGARALETLALSPLMLPGIVSGVALLQAGRLFGIVDAFALLLLGHTALAIPYVMRTLIAGLAGFDASLIEAARTLGFSYPAALIRIVLPNVVPGIFTGAVFAFLASFDNYSISLFVSTVTARPLPIQMIQYLEEGADPSLAAICTVLIAITVVLLLMADRAIGLKRIASG